MMIVMKIFTLVFAVGISCLFGWIIYKKLSSFKIIEEFIAPTHSELDSVTIDKEISNSKRRNFILVSSVVLTIAMGVFHFGFGGMRNGTNVADIQEVAISGAAIWNNHMDIITLFRNYDGKTSIELNKKEVKIY
jgi:hypothetical protein